MITAQYQKFFKGLSANNNKEWFQENKKSYEQDVKKPFIALIEGLLPEIQQLEPAISMDPKKSLFRINRDIRFAKDKTPYNTIMKAGIAPGGKKSELPGFYLGISADEIYVGGGLFGISGPDLKKIRYYIADHCDEFTRIVESDAFKKVFPKLNGDQAKRIDKELQPVLEKTPYILNKQFYAMSELPLSKYLNADKLPKIIMAHFETISPLNQYLKKALL